jgi:hypothetical protein
VLLLSVYLWSLQAVELVVQPPAAWFDAAGSLVAGLVAPGVTWVIWRGDRRAGVSQVRRMRRAQLIAVLLGGLSVLVYMWLLVAVP